MVEIVEKTVYKMFVNHHDGLRIKDAIGHLSVRGVAGYEVVTAVQTAFLDLYKEGAISMPDLPTSNDAAAFVDWITSNIIEPEHVAVIHALRFSMPSSIRREYPTMVANV